MRPYPRVPRYHLTMRSVLRLVVMAVALGVLASACGGGDLVSSTPVPPRESVPQVSEPDTQAPSTSLPTPTTTSAPGTTTPAATDGELRLIIQPDASGRLPADVEIGCPAGPTFPVAALDEIRPLAGSGLDKVEAAARWFLDGEEGQSWPQEDWLILHEAEDRVLLTHLEELEPESQVSFIEVTNVDGEWKWDGARTGGPCPLRTSILETLNEVEWRIDSAAEPLTPASTTVAVLVTERNCVGGQPMGDRLLGPEIVMTESAVLLAFAAEPPPGDAHECPGNPEQPVVVELPEPLGDREVLDGLAVMGNLEDYLD